MAREEQAKKNQVKEQATNKLRADIAAKEIERNTLEEGFNRKSLDELKEQEDKTVRLSTMRTLHPLTGKPQKEEWKGAKKSLRG